MEKTELKKIGSKIIEGCFEDLLDLLHKRYECLTPKQARYLIVCCCNSCNVHMENIDKLDEHSLITAVKCLAKLDTCKTTEEYHSYIQSIFFICKLLIKKNYENFLKIENVILPPFIPRPGTEKQKSVYKSICELILNNMSYLVRHKVAINKEKIMSVGYLLSRIITESSNHSIFTEFVFNYGLGFPSLTIDLSTQYEYFLQNVTVMRTIPTEFQINGILFFLKFSVHLYTSYMKLDMLQNSQQCVQKILSVIPRDGEWEDLAEIVKIFECIIDPDIDQNRFIFCKDILVKSYKLHRKSENFNDLCRLLFTVMTAYSNYCHFHDQKTFGDPNRHMIVYEILDVLMDYFFEQSTCKGVCNCLHKKFEVRDVAVCIVMQFNALVNNNNVGVEYISKVKVILEKFHNGLVSMKKNKCEVYEKWWSVISIHLYNIAVVLYRKQNFDGALLFALQSLKYHSLLNISGDDHVFQSACDLIGTMYQKQNKYKEALIFTALGIISVQKKPRTKGLIKWVRIKSSARETDSKELQEYTILSLKNEIPKEYLLIDQTQSKEDQINLLISELDIYRDKWKSKIPMMCTFSHLCQIGDKQIIMKTFVQMFTDEEVRVHENVLESVKNIFHELENSKTKINNSSMLYLCFYYFSVYNHQTVDMVHKNLEEMDRISKLKKSTEPADDVTDALDHCDVVSVYENLKINGEKLKKLGKILSILENVILKGLSPVLFQEVDPMKVYELTRNIAIEFILHSDYYNLLRSLFLAFNLAEFMNNQALVLECSGYFLRYLNFSDLEHKMEKIICDIQNHEENFQYLMKYYMNLSHFHLSGRNIKQAYHHYKNAKKYEEYFIKDDKKDWYLEISMEFLLFKLLNLGRSMKIEMEMEFTYGPLISAYNMIISKYTKEPQWTTYCMQLLLDILETLIEVYFDLRMPREVRCFGKYSLTITQQHVIPVLSAKLLSYLAYADLWCERFDDCRVKLNGISDILLLNETERCNKNMKQKFKMTVTSVDDIMEGISEIMLDPPVTFNFQTSPASPVLQVQGFRSPFFVNHTVCKCLHCTSLECQQTVLTSYHLEALWYMHKKQITISDNFFKGLFKLYEILSVKEKEIRKVFENYVIQYSGKFFVFTKKTIQNASTFEEIQIRASVSYVKFLTSSGAREAAEKYLDIALKDLTKVKMFYPNFYGEMLLQKIGLICEKNTKTCMIEEKIKQGVNNHDLKIKTPEGRTLDNSLPKIKSPKVKRFLPAKLLKFDLEAESESSATPSRSLENSKTSARTPRTRDLPPSLRNINTPNFKTPTLSKARIFAPDSKSVKVKTDLDEKTKQLTSRLQKKISSDNSSAEIEKEEEKKSPPIRRSRRKKT